MRKEWNTPEIDSIEFGNTEYGPVSSNTYDAGWYDEDQVLHTENGDRS